MQEINLEEILAKWISCSIQEFGESEEVSDAAAKASIEGGSHWYTLQAMKDACRQVVELAAENAKVKEDYIEDYYSLTYDGIEAYAIHKDRDGDPSSISLFTIDKNSIIKTIEHII